jgi:hypothetical protein
MRVFAKLALAAVALAALTTSASAAVSFTSPNPFDTNGIGPGESIVWNFDGIADTAHFTFSGGTYSAPSPGWVAPPANDPTTFAAAEAGSNAVFATKPGFELNSLSFYLGSLDTYNTLSFFHNGTLIQAFTGSQLTIPNPADGNQSAGDTNRRYFFTFDAADGVNQVVFSTTAPAFEFDTIAASISSVPEPQTWAMMILGFGFIGFMLRNGGRRQRALAA